jgi:hypothetical protein
VFFIDDKTKGYAPDGRYDPIHLNDHDELRANNLLALWVGTSDVRGERRVRDRDKGYPLAGSSTLNRLELSDPASTAHSRYKKIAADPQALDRLLVDLFLESYPKPTREICLDLDAIDDPLHVTRKVVSSMATTGPTAGMPPMVAMMAQHTRYHQIFHPYSEKNVNADFTNIRMCLIPLLAA